MKSSHMFLILLVIALVLFGYMICSLREGFVGQSSEPADINSVDSKGIIDAAEGVPNSVIPNAPFPPDVGQINSLKPVDLEANYEQLKDKIHRIQQQLPDDVQRQVVNIAPYIIGNMIDKRTPIYAVNP